MPGEDYITILSESLQKKNKILDAIRAANEEQKVLLADEMLGPDDFERTLDKKAALVEELNCLDEGSSRSMSRFARKSNRIWASMRSRSG